MDRDTAVQRVNAGLGFRVAGNPLEPQIVLRLQEAQRDLERGKTLPKFLLQEKQELVLPAGQSTAALPAGFLRDWDEDPLHFTPVSSARSVFLERKMYRDALQGLGARGGSGMVTNPVDLWANGQTYLVGRVARDVADNSIWTAIFQHVSAASGTFAQDRAGAAAGMWVVGSTTTSIGAPQVPRVYVILRSTIDFLVRADRTYTFSWSWYKAGQLLLANIENEWLFYAPEWLIGEAGYRIAFDLRDQEGKMIFQDMRDRARSAVLGDQFELDESGGMFEMGGGL